MATITSVGIFATGFRTFRHVRHVAALDLASWAGAMVPTSAMDRGKDRAMARVGVEHGVGLGLDLGLGLGPGRTGRGGGGRPWAEGAPPPPRSSGSYAVPVLYAPRQPSKRRRGPWSRPQAGVSPGAPSPGVPD
jgi:hypothetical protein